MTATGVGLIVLGWILISVGRWKANRGRITAVLAIVGSCMVAVGMLTVVQSRN